MASGDAGRWPGSCRSGRLRVEAATPGLERIRRAARRHVSQFSFSRVLCGHIPGPADEPPGSKRQPPDDRAELSQLVLIVYSSLEDARNRVVGYLGVSGSPDAEDDHLYPLPDNSQTEPDLTGWSIRIDTYVEEEGVCVAIWKA
mgnify:CR=1 FL=1